MYSLPLRLTLLITLALSSSALGQARIGPLVGTQILGKDAYNDPPFWGAKLSFKLNQKMLLSLEYHGWNSDREHIFRTLNGRLDIVTSSYLPTILTTSKKQLLLAGLQREFLLIWKKVRVLAGLHLGYQYLDSKNELFNETSLYIPPPIDHQEENLLGISSLALDFELFHQVNLFAQLRYGHRLGNLSGSGVSSTRHFAQILFGMDLLVF